MKTFIDTMDERTDNMYNTLINLEKNMRRLANESKYLDSQIARIFDKRLAAYNFGRTIPADEMHLDCAIIEAANNCIARNEYRLRNQRELHARLLRMFNNMLKVRFEAILK